MAAKHEHHAEDNVVVPPQLQWAEALDRRAQEVIEGVLSDEATMAQIRESMAEAERGEDPIPWRKLKAEHRPERISRDV